MGLETATFISGLTPTWPTAGELKSQGDDHLRLIKATLQGTFPNAAKPFYFPSAEVISGTQVLDATDQNNVQLVDTSSGNIAITLPSTLAAADKGWKIEIVKTSSDTNAIIVSPASGTIASKSGSTATIRVGIVCEPSTFRWTGSGWICSKPGPMIGSTENYDGAAIPPGYLLDDGSAFSNTAFAELFAVMGSSTLFDKRGRVEAGVDGTGVRLTSSANGFGGPANRGAASGAESVLPTVAQMTPHFHGAVINDPGHPHEAYWSYTLSAYPAGAGSQQPIGAVGNSGTNHAPIASATTGITVNSANGTNTTASVGGGAGHPSIQPTIIVNKIKRAC